MSLLLKKLEEEEERRREIIKKRLAIRKNIIDMGEKGLSVQEESNIIIEAERELKEIEKFIERIKGKEELSNKNPIKTTLLSGNFLISALVSFKEDNEEEVFFFKSNINKYLPFVVFRNIFNINEDIEEMIKKGERKRVYSLEIKKISILRM